jgi:hypothetical protein
LMRGAPVAGNYQGMKRSLEQLIQKIG